MITPQILRVRKVYIIQTSKTTTTTSKSTDNPRNPKCFTELVVYSPSSFSHYIQNDITHNNLRITTKTTRYILSLSLSQFGYIPISRCHNNVEISNRKKKKLKWETVGNTSTRPLFVCKIAGRDDDDDDDDGVHTMMRKFFFIKMFFKCRGSTEKGNI